MALRGVLFDLDGTLADTASAEREVWDAIAAIIEQHVPAIDRHELYERYSEVFEPHWTAYLEGRTDFLQYRWNRLQEAIAPWGELHHELFDAYRVEKRNGLRNLRLFDDALETVRGLRSRGLRVGLLTNGPSQLQRTKIEVTALEPELDSIAVSEEIGAAKPDAEAFRTATRLLGCPTPDVAMVGDSPEYDISGALGAGLHTAVLVAGDLDLNADGAVIVRRLGEVPAALGVA
jgi:putative hydrolase of the HAD superfamily